MRIIFLVGIILSILPHLGFAQGTLQIICNSHKKANLQDIEDCGESLLWNYSSAPYNCDVEKPECMVASSYIDGYGEEKDIIECQALSKNCHKERDGRPCSIGKPEYRTFYKSEEMDILYTRTFLSICRI